MAAGFKGQWERNRDRFVFSGTLLFSLLLMAFHQSPPLLFLHKTISGSTGKIQEWIFWIPRVWDVQKKNQKLIEQVGQLSLQKNRYEEVLMENRRLRHLLNFKERSGLDFVAAEIIGRGTVGVEGSILLNKGQNDGCQKNRALMTERGLVGKLLFVGPSTSVGQLLTDPNFRVSAKVQRSRVVGIVRWLYGNLCVMEGVPQRSDVRVGDRILTSGYSQVFPPGIAIGRIVEVAPEKSGLFSRILLRTEVDFGTLEEVLVLKDGPPE